MEEINKPERWYKRKVNMLGKSIPVILLIGLLLVGGADKFGTQYKLLKRMFKVLKLLCLPNMCLKKILKPNLIN